MKEEVMPYLVVEKRNNDFDYINLADLDLFEGMTYNSLPSLDKLLKNYTIRDLKDAIIRANILVDSNIEDKKLFIKQGNYKLPVLTSDITHDFNIRAFIKDSFNDKRLNNIFYNKLASITKNDHRGSIFKALLSVGTAEEFYDSLSWLDYKEQREFYFYLYNEVILKDKNLSAKLKREKEKNGI